MVKIDNYHPGKTNAVVDALSRKERVNMMSLTKELIRENGKARIRD